MTVVLGPRLPGGIQVVAGHLGRGVDLAAVADERARRADEIGKGHDRVPRRRRLGEAAPVVETPETLERPVEDARQLGQELVGEGRVLTTEPAGPQRQDDEAIGYRTRGIAEARKLVADQQEPRREGPGPGFLVLAVYGQHVLARDRQQPFDDRLDVGAAQASVRDDRKWLADQRLKAEVGAEGGQGGTGVVAPADERL